MHHRLDEFRHDTPRFRTILSQDCGTDIRDELAIAGLSRAMVVCSEREATSVLTRGIVSALGERHAGTFDRVLPHPTLAAAEDGANLARSLLADCLIAIGGGGSSDQAKGIALWLADDGELRPISATNTGRRPAFAGALGNPALPIVAVPTTASGAELTPGFGQKDTNGHKILFRDARLFPSLIVLDPAAMATVPMRILVPTCMNAVAHCVEALYSRDRDPVSDLYAVEGFDLLVAGLRALAQEPGGREACRLILVGANLAGRAIVNARTGIHHGICHVLGGAGVPHGIANTIMLPHVVRFNAEAGGAHLGELMHHAGAGDVEGLAQALASLPRPFGLPSRLGETTLTREQIPALIERVLREPGLHFNPRQGVSATDVEQLLLAAW